LLALFTLISIGTLVIFFFEPSIQVLMPGTRWLVAFFQSMTALTTVGFNTIPLQGIVLPVLLVIVLLMYVGASPSGTGGGMKSTTFVALIAIMISRIRGKSNVTFLGKAIPLERMYVATSTFILYASVIFLATFLLSVTENFSLQEILFETTSAIGTVGLSVGITASLSTAGKLILVGVRFVGRLGVITFGLAILAKRKKIVSKEAEADLAV
jgi:trk system potassium uptake protein TrkH